MNETEAYTQLALIIGTLLCIPFIYRLFYALGKTLASHYLK